MAPSAVFLQIKRMIEKDWLVLNPTVVENQLRQLMEEGKLTPEEYRALMQLYVDKYKSDDIPS